jgi:hypothetical protein
MAKQHETGELEPLKFLEVERKDAESRQKLPLVRRPEVAPQPQVQEEGGARRMRAGLPIYRMEEERSHEQPSLLYHRQKNHHWGMRQGRR